MKTPDLPQNEQERLSTLKSLTILDSAPDERFDRLTRIATKLFDVPVALVSLVDKNRQWFKSCQGLDITETPRDISFCGHAILGEGAFVVEDAHNDERFIDNPLLIGQKHIRFYAGYPIRYLDGSKLGTLCIKDVKPRQFREDDRQLLKDLATIVEHEIQAVELATMDELTGILNRRGFNMSAEKSLNICKRGALPVALVFLDLNEFKPINDKFGHAEGDKALQQFASILDDVGRDSDIVARMGGDEFVILLVDADKNAVDEVMKRFSQQIQRCNEQQALGYHITFSYGIVLFEPEKHATIDELLSEGDALMYQRKKSR
ncbi:sensor domain-containing diguanylate cyclase [Methylophaga sulfidovorans]|uniref:Diguanylate cyclase with GAF sensor n=1 Tax=Methylophaga sulfidovorans TaxID=45496 RepID=A0A1I3YWZ0_9GAMM|nr:sensor domain-containing diguanylate cyclase [Methylophaga sulfidovorans]SFK36392.1 diguanylate cyclase with GAF sensor [Methylophaga sulfidovorans]